MALPGVIFGLLAALGQSLSYLATRHFVQRRPPGASRALLVLSHIHMGIASALLLPFFWLHVQIDWSRTWWPLFWTNFFYVLGQIGLMIALRYAEPSRVSPLLGFKVVVLAGLTGVLGPTPLHAIQWSAVAVCVTGAMALYHTGGRTHPMAMFGLAMACISYALSDWNVKGLVDSFITTRSLAWRSFLGVLLSYGLCGLAALPLLPWFGTRNARDWRGAMPFAAAWFVAMIFLFACFGYVGPVYGNILQSTRGLISILMAVALMRLGAKHIEPAAGRGEFFRRLAAGALMFVAVLLYQWPVK